MYPRILVPLDGSDACDRGLSEAIKIAKEQGSQLRLLHVVVAPTMDCGYGTGGSRQEVIASQCRIGKGIIGKAETLTREQGLSPECVMFESVGGSAGRAILDEANQWQASLIVMGSHARHGLHRVGCDTAEVLIGSPVPVLLVRQDPRAA
ncbi:MAG TPA: universal stress protein [Steroidobacteraceae bacterium]|nr:universal stress protein [Steroidobacteraceae bacterium]